MGNPRQGEFRAHPENKNLEMFFDGRWIALDFSNKEFHENADNMSALIRNTMNYNYAMDMIKDKDSK